jgi:hypothetical protein
VRKKIRKMGRKMIRMMHKHLEDAEKEESRGADTKSFQEVKTERSEDEAEEKVDDDDSEDTTDEEGMKHEEAPKTQEIRKKEPVSAMVITDAIGMRT